MTYEQRLKEERDDGFKKGEVKGRKEERQEGIRKMINALKALQQSDEQIKVLLKEQYNLSEEECDSLIKS